jgi:TolA-binding protein
MVRVVVIGVVVWLAAWSAHAVEPPVSDAARAAYASAAALQNREAWDLAAEEWQALLRAHPADPLAVKGRYYLAVCQLKAGDWPAAEKTLRDVIASKADAETRALARLELGRGLFRTAQAKPAPAAFATAATALADFLATSPTHPQAAEAASLAAESIWQAGRRDDAIVAWQAFLRDHAGAPQVPDVLYALGVGLAEQGKRPDAASVLERFAKEHPKHRLADDVALWRADLALALERPADAEKIAAPVAAGNGPRAIDALERVADAQWALKNHAAAAAAFAKLATAGPPGPRTSRATLMAGRGFAEAGQADEARKWLTAGIAGGGQTALDAGHRLAVFELDAKRPEAALDAATRALAAAGKPADADAGAIAALELDRADALWAIPARKGEAVAAFGAVADRYPATPAAGPATSMAALALLQAGKPAEALARADAFLATHAAQATPAAIDDVRAIRAESLLALGKRAEAAAAYRDLAKASQQAARIPAWRLREATALAAAGSWKPAHDLLAAVAPQLAGDLQAEAMLLDATALVELEDPGSAAAVLAALEKAHPTWKRRDEVLLLAARALKEKGDSKAALATAERLAKEFPAGRLADQAWYRLGQLRQEAGQHDQAIEAFGKSLAAKPDGSRGPWALLATGWCHEAKGRLPEAIAAWTTLCEKHATSTAAASALIARADARHRTGDFAGGLADVERLLAEGGDLAKRLDAAAVAEARFIQGLCLVGQEKHAQAAATFRTLLADAPAFPAADRAGFELGLALAAAGKPDDAAAAGKPDEAAAAFADLVKRYPQSTYAADAWLEIAERRWAADDWAAAAEAYRAAIAAAGKDPELASLAEQARHKLGWTYVMRKEPGPAAEAFQAQLAAAPNGPLAADAAALLGDALVSLGRQADAAPAFARALADPATLSSDTLRGLAFIRSAEAAAGREAWAESLAIAEKFLAASPDAPRAPEARYAAAWARQNLGRLDEALAGYRSLADGLRTELAARARLMEGEVLFEQGQHKEAIKAFFKVAYGFGEQNAPPAFHPWQAQATFEAARCFEVLGRQEQARSLYAELVERYPMSEHVPAARKRLEALGQRTAAAGAKS